MVKSRCARQLRATLITVFSLALSRPAVADDWEHAEEVNPITLAVVSIASVRYRDGHEQRALIARCTASSLSVYFAAGEFVGGDRARVDFRFSEGEPRVGIQFNVSTDSMAIFAPNATLLREWIEGIVSSDELFLRWYDYRGVPNDTVVSLDGAARAMARLPCVDPTWLPRGDADEDDIRNEDDRCPLLPEDEDGFEDEDGCPDHDHDHDGVPNEEDACPNDLEDVDGDRDEDGCPEESDSDGIDDLSDNCPFVDNADQADADADGRGDVCDACPVGATPDSDGDGICDAADSCEGDNSAGDTDGDGICDDRDPCNGEQDADSDRDGVCDDADRCLGDDSTGDVDADGVCGNYDLCVGNDHTGDQDGDGFCSDLDNCPRVSNPGQEDGDRDGVGDACPSSAQGVDELRRGGRRN